MPPPPPPPPPPTPVILVTPEEYEAAQAAVMRNARFGITCYVFCCPVAYARALQVFGQAAE